MFWTTRLAYRPPQVCCCSSCCCSRMTGENVMIGRLPHIQVKAKRTALKIPLTAAAAAPLMMLASNKARGIILYDRWYRNKSAPTGDISGSGWQWQGNWGSFTRTPIAKHYFDADSHLGGSLGQ